VLSPPVFLVSAPGSGDGSLLLSLAHAAGVWHARGQRATFMEELPGVEPLARGYDGHRLTAEHADGIGEAAREALRASLADREGRSIDQANGNATPIAGGARLALRIPFLDEAFPEARFVFLHRAPEEAVPEMLAGWRSEQLVSVPDLPDWEGPQWSLPLIPDWRSLSGAPLEEVVAEQWRAITDIALDDLEALDADRWRVLDRAALLADPRGQLRELCEFLGIPYDQALLSPIEHARRAQGNGAPVSAELAGALARTAPAVAHAVRLAAPAAHAAPAATAPAAPADPTAAFGSHSTGSFAHRLRRLNSSLLISTYQTNKLVVARQRNGLLNTHFRQIDKPMGIATAPGRFAVGTRTEVWDMRDMPKLAPKVEPVDTHDACYLPRNRHVTGDIAIHDLGYAGGELWLVATGFSCLATLDADHSFVPRWKPPWISAIQPGDRCHLNGLAVVDDRPRYVTALGRTDEPGAWRPGKATDGVIVDVQSNEVVAEGLSMPHSPRWHNQRLWVLESGKGELCVVDLDKGTTETVVELPGFTRGMALSGRTAFVGLSQIRESSTFGDLPLIERLDERQCGVWVVDLPRGEIEGFLRFDDLVQEVFDVALLTGKRYPEIAEPGSSAVATAYELP
jgi:uncharacterized protein (TIGR03032 family)